jgi:probable lipoprotein NlpC
LFGCFWWYSSSFNRIWSNVLKLIPLFIQYLIFKMTTLEKVNSVVQTALSYQGIPYKFGGASREGVDCSGLVMVSFQSIGVQVSHFAPDQANLGEVVYIDQLQPGDLVFFTDYPGRHKITHVGMITRTNYPNRSVTFIHSPCSGFTVHETELISPYWQSVFLKAVRPSVFV